MPNRTRSEDVVSRRPFPPNGRAEPRRAKTLVEAIPIDPREVARARPAERDATRSGKP